VEVHDDLSFRLRRSRQFFKSTRRLPHVRLSSCNVVHGRRLGNGLMGKLAAGNLFLKLRNRKAAWTPVIRTSESLPSNACCSCCCCCSGNKVLEKTLCNSNLDFQTRPLHGGRREWTPNSRVCDLPQRTYKNITVVACLPVSTHLMIRGCSSYSSSRTRPRLAAGRRRRRCRIHLQMLYQLTCSSRSTAESHKFYPCEEMQSRKKNRNKMDIQIDRSTNAPSYDLWVFFLFVDEQQSTKWI